MPPRGAREKLPRTYAELNALSEEMQLKLFSEVMRSDDIEAQVNHMLTNVLTPEPGDPPITVPAVKEVIDTGVARGFRLDKWQPCSDALSFAARNDFSGKGLAYLLSLGLKNVNSPNFSGATPLILASCRGNAKAVRVLFDACDKAGVKLDAHKPDSLGVEALYWAVQANDNVIAQGSEEDFADIVELLVKRGGCGLDRVMFKGVRGVSALGRACERAAHILARKCIELGADLNMPAPSVRGMTPLHFAVYNNAEKCVKLLLKAGADTRAELPAELNSDTPNFIPILYCAGMQNLRIADMILRHEEGKGLPAFTVENGIDPQMVSQLEHVVQSTEVFRKTGDIQGGMGGKVFRMMSEGDPEKLRQTMANEDRALARARAAALKEQKECSGCGQFGAFLKKCGGCQLAKYCTKECQVQHWKKGGHKQECARLKEEQQRQQDID